MSQGTGKAKIRKQRPRQLSTAHEWRALAAEIVLLAAVVAALALLSYLGWR